MPNQIKVNTLQKKCPEAVSKRLLAVGGRNLYGQPNFRVVWGWSRLTTVGGKWEEPWDKRVIPMAGDLPMRTSYEYRQLPKYEPWFRWHLERWRKPSFYGTPETFYANTRLVEDGRVFYELGEFPHKGEHEHCFTLQTPDGGYLDLSPWVVEYICQAIVRSQEVVTRDKRAAFERLMARERKKEQEWSDWADAVIDDAAPAFGLAPRSFVPPQYRAEP